MFAEQHISAASAETVESWKLITFHLHSSEFQNTFAVNSAQSSWKRDGERKKKNEYLIVQSVGACIESCFHHAVAPSQSFEKNKKSTQGFWVVKIKIVDTSNVLWYTYEP